MKKARDHSTMPSTRISTGQWARGKERELIEVVQNALLEGLKVPDWDRDIVLHLFDDEHRIVPSGRSERSTRIEIILYSGRTLETKRALYRSMVDNLARFGVPKTDVKIILLEMPRENWGIRGGIPGSEVELDSGVDMARD
jgi:phenylpyruvate tautomerase PptA (4-oxalocrotonate tautomerase family)